MPESIPPEPALTPEIEPLIFDPVGVDDPELLAAERLTFITDNYTQLAAVARAAAARKLLGRPRQDVEDVTQVTLEKALLEMPPGLPLGWIRVVARNRAIDYNRNGFARYEQPVEHDRLPQRSVPSVETTFMQKGNGLIDYMQDALRERYGGTICSTTGNDMGEQNITIIHILAGGGTYEDCSQATGLKMGTIRSRIYRMRDMLKRQRQVDQPAP